ncbi:MAG: DEAD/DEAH box helicase [Bryobacteraceae bacterium]
MAWELGLNSNSFHPELALDGERFGELRPAQKEAYRLVGWDASYLWGPPGTGKTTTLGYLLAEYLRARKTSRILLISSTHVAVDTALLKTDERARLVFPKDPRPPLLRFGSRFDPARYENCKHLIPVRDKSQIGVYERHLQDVPSPGDPERYRIWRKKLDAIREKFTEERRYHLKTARLAAMTATYAVSQFDELASNGKYDLVVFDEASQVGKCHAMTLATLGRNVLFAGDHKQLSPIVQSAGEGARSWLGKSAFDWILRPSLENATCMLDEQWRMAPQISGVISEFFYGSKLRVAEPVAADPAWLADRTPNASTLLSGGNVCLIDVKTRARPAKDFAGYCCPESAEIVAALAVDLQLSCPDEDLCILTPFRAQRREIEKELQARNASVTLVSTVHRIQGLERRSVIFDPVCPSSEFVSDEGGMRLMNVALSRAKSRLIILMQRDWIENRLLQFLAERFRIAGISESGLSKLLSVRLAAARPTVAVATSKPQKVVTAVVSKLERFEEELMRALGGKANSAENRKQCVLDVKGRTEFKSLTYQEVDQVCERIDRLWPVPNRTKR